MIHPTIYTAMKKIIACLPTAAALLCVTAAFFGAAHQLVIAAMYGVLAAFAWNWALTKEEKKR